ncbi:zf-TFIIB domain-containing protein [Chelativorans sp. J32]|uniref:TFIIB-type zinc ribbon-containing protein n=1 Tax=Chelativorans sp. J32 TaxID=935840 RepID=UPI0004830FD6|nr:zf-TFIIB domain-containing protein [Chelativorans sp. J32]
MQCPLDGAELVMSERQGIEIDYCPKCRGVWLDRGELDKIIERTADDAPSAQYGQRPQSQSRDHYGDRDHGAQRPYKKKKSLLGEIFDF